MWAECQEPGCPFQSNSPKHVKAHVADTGHEVESEED